MMLKEMKDTNIPVVEREYPTSYRELKIGKTIYCVTSVFKGEKDLGVTLEKLAAQKILNDFNASSKEILRNN